MAVEKYKKEKTEQKQLMTPKVNLTFDLDLDPRVKHLTWQVTTDVQVTL